MEKTFCENSELIVALIVQCVNSARRAKVIAKHCYASVKTTPVILKLPSNTTPASYHVAVKPYRYTAITRWGAFSRIVYAVVILLEPAQNVG